MSWLALIYLEICDKAKLNTSLKSSSLFLEIKTLVSSANIDIENITNF